MRTLFVILSFMLALAGASAEGCVPSSSQSSAPGGILYMTDPTWLIICHPECIPEFWVYEESNGIEGWQRSDEQHDDTCGGQIPADTIIF